MTLLPSVIISATVRMVESYTVIFDVCKGQVQQELMSRLPHRLLGRLTC